MYFERHTHADPELPVYFNYQNHLVVNAIVGLHWHETSEWILLTEGEADFTINNENYHCKAGDLVLINPQLPHSIRMLTSPCNYFCMIPDNTILSPFGEELCSFYTDPIIEDEEIKALYRNIIKENEDRKQSYKSCIKASIVMMSALAKRRYQKDGVEARLLDDNAMCITKNAIKYMEEHYAEDFSGEVLAAELGFSRSYLCHVISKVTGQSLTENLLHVRCNKAKEYLRHGVPAGKVGYLVGFKNLSYFCRVYKRMMGVSPSSHRKK